MTRSRTTARLALLAAAALACACGAGPAPGLDVGAAPRTLVVTSAAFEDGAEIPATFTTDGDDTSPPLAWTGAPEGTASFALVVLDPDAPGGTWVHWVLWNLREPRLDAAVPPEPALPSGAVQGRNSWNRAGYGGPSPPSGTHRYVFEVFALDRTLDLGATSGTAELAAAARGHVLAWGTLVGRYAAR